MATWRNWLFEKWGMTELSLSVGFLDVTFNPSDPDRDAAWDLYVELLTRITTQDLHPERGDEQTALTSVYSLFGLTRETLKAHGRNAGEFAKVAVVVLNQIIRPFTEKWHAESLAGAFDDESRRLEFRTELAQLQGQLRTYSRMLADMAGVEDMTELASEV